MLARIVKEPLLHFLALALLIFAAYALINRSEATPPDQIVITASKIEQLAGLYAAMWRRPPTEAELKGLVDDFVREEIYYREAVALGLDKDDTIIRRRLRNKMEFLNQAEAEMASPSEGELRSYLQAHPSKFEVEPQIAFQHVFLSPEKRGASLQSDAVTLLTKLGSRSDVDVTELGDGSLLPHELPATGRSAIGKIFGPDFAVSLDRMIPGTWSGPIQSAFGWHLVFITDRTAARAPELAEVHGAVAREWMNAKRAAIEEARFEALLKRYGVRIDGLAQNKAQP